MNKILQEAALNIEPCAKQDSRLLKLWFPCLTKTLKCRLYNSILAFIHLGKMCTQVKPKITT